MGQIRHGCATTTHAIRAAIQRSQAGNAALGRQPGILAPVDGTAPAGLDLAEANQELMRSGLAETVSRLREAGLRVIILGGVPEIG